MITEEYTTYTLNNFVIYEINSNELVLMHNYGIVKIKEARLIEEIKKWDNNNIKSVHEKEQHQGLERPQGDLGRGWRIYR